jgi:hypothetical protein
MMPSEPVTSREGRAIADAARMVKAAAWYLIVVGIFGVVEEHALGVVLAALGSAALAAGSLIRWHQSRAVAGALLVGALANAVARILFAPGMSVTGWLVVAAWCFAGAFAVYATFRFHAVNRSPVA